MTGPEHYRQAERLLSSATEVPVFEDGSSPWAARAIAFAQVHATLALAAATALNDAEGGLSIRDHEAWMAAAGTPKDVAEAPPPPS